MEENNKTLLNTGTKGTRERIDFILSIFQENAEEPEILINLASEILTMLSRKPKDFNKFQEELQDYKLKVNDILQQYQSAPPSYRSNLKTKLVEINRAFELSCRVHLQKFEYLMSERSTLSNVIINIEGLLK